ncbi:MAG: beta-lactamase family protein [Actinobacteria bacterium]|nr:beta-lactamase family protein [Actinomycetota bacterium]
MPVEGSVAAGFTPVRDAFEENLALRDEVGAAFAVVHEGEVVVDLWGGVADVETGSAWDEDTIQLIFSGSKGLVAVCMLMLVDRGQVDPSDRVADHWPEFEAGGKERVTVAEVMSHRSRLPGIRRRLGIEDLLDDNARAAELAAQVQEIDPRARDVYHALTYGWLCGELVRRIDGRSVGRFFADEIATPLNLDIWIGLPAELESRASRLTLDGSWEENLPAEEDFAADPLLNSVWNNPPLIVPGNLYWNRPEFHAAEIPAVNAIATARSLARLYGCLAQGGSLDGVRLLSEETLKLALTEVARRHDPFAEQVLAYSFGFELPAEFELLGPAAVAFGHSGLGTSAHGAWPERKVGFSYCMNQMRWAEPDPRPASLLRALDACLA